MDRRERRGRGGGGGHHPRHVRDLPPHAALPWPRERRLDMSDETVAVRVPRRPHAVRGKNGIANDDSTAIAMRLRSKVQPGEEQQQQRNQARHDLHRRDDEGVPRLIPRHPPLLVVAPMPSTSTTTPFRTIDAVTPIVAISAADAARTSDAISRSRFSF